jgi:hypothetical protein
MSRDDTETSALVETMEPHEALAVTIERHIERRACGRVRDLRVACSDGRIVLQGRCRTYHAKQIVQEAALDLAGGRPGIISNQIVVR